jgi:hypothetical protein
MKRSWLVICVLIAATAVVAAQQAPPAPKDLPSLTGKWEMALNMSMGQSKPTLTLKQDGEKLTGTYAGRYGTSPLAGTIKDRTIEFSVTIDVSGEKVEMVFAGEVASDGQSMKGDADLAQAGDGTWTAVRAKAN